MENTLVIPNLKNSRLKLEYFRQVQPQEIKLNHPDLLEEYRQFLEDEEQLKLGEFFDEQQAQFIGYDKYGSFCGWDVWARSHRKYFLNLSKEFIQKYGVIVPDGFYEPDFYKNQDKYYQRFCRKMGYSDPSLKEQTLSSNSNQTVKSPLEKAKSSTVHKCPVAKKSTKSKLSTESSPTLEKKSISAKAETSIPSMQSETESTHELKTKVPVASKSDERSAKHGLFIDYSSRYLQPLEKSNRYDDFIINQYVLDLFKDHLVYDENKKAIWYFSKVSNKLEILSLDLFKNYAETIAIFIEENSNISVKVKNEVCKKLRNNSTVKSIWEMLKSQIPKRLNLNEFQNTGSQLYQVRNKILDFSSSMKVLDPSPYLYITKHSKVDFEEKAQCENFDKFLFKTFAGKMEIIKAFWTAFYMTLAEIDCDRQFFIVSGDMNSMLLAIMLDFVGLGYGTLLNSSTFDSRKYLATKYELCTIVDKKFVVVNASASTSQICPEALKTIVSPLPLLFEQKYKGHEVLETYATLWFESDSLESLPNDPSVLSKLKVFKTFLFDGADKIKKSQFRDEYSGILNRIIEAGKRFHAEGFNEPAPMKTAKKSLIIDKLPIAAFLEEIIVLAPDKKMQSDPLYRLFKLWCKSNGLIPDSQRTFSSFLNQKFDKIKTDGGKQFFRGIGLSKSGYDLASRVEVSEE